jgi:hypothetical protein
MVEAEALLELGDRAGERGRGSEVRLTAINEMRPLRKFMALKLTVE